MTATIRERLAVRGDAVMPRVPCIRCTKMTRADDMICTTCWTLAMKSAAKGAKR